ncbi:Protein ClpV1 [Nymphon striatum]|nr:Protein ClpV1 [Nymphon striatum]
MEDSAPVLQIRSLAGPTKPKPPNVEGENAWRLISHLSLNYLSLVDEDETKGAVAIRELLTLYGDMHRSETMKQINGLLSVKSNSAVRRIPGAGPITFGRGLEISLNCKESAFDGTGVYMLGSVLEHFFAKYVSLNSFTQTNLSTVERGEIKQWSFGFYEALRLIECYYKDRSRLGETLKSADDMIRLGQTPTAAFAPSTLSSATTEKDDLLHLNVFFFGLFGPNGALPLHLTEYANERVRTARDESFIHFLDMFHHRLLCLFYRAWANKEPTVHFDRPEQDKFHNYTGSLLGIGTPGVQDRDQMPDSSKMHYAGHMSSQTHHAEGLSSVLQAFFKVPTGTSLDGSEPGEASGAISPAQMGKQEALQQYTVDLTERARTGELDPIVGRDDEIRQMVDILMRRRQNNPILTGEAGVGKTAVVEGLAQRVASGDIPPSLKDVSIRTLDMGLLQAGASMKGEFENRLKQIIEEVQSSEKPIILFIDEAHTLIGAGGAEGTGDAANLLKPALARGTLRTVAATTWAEYKKYFEKDPALTRRFQVVNVEEPTEEKATLMLRSMASVMEKHHKVLLLDQALEDAVKLSHRYIPARQLPDKAISVLDTACARVAVSQHATPAEVEDRQRKLQSLEVESRIIEREAAVGIDVGERKEKVETQKTEVEAELVELDKRLARRNEVGTGSKLEKSIEETVESDDEETISESDAAEANTDEETIEEKEGGLSPEQREESLEKLKKLQAELADLQGETPLILPSVDGQAIASVIADWTGIPVGKMVRDEMGAVLKLSETLNERVVGQKHALDTIAKRVQTSRAELDSPNKPIGVFMLCGPSGVGKTETGLALAESLYGGEENIITINMSEFQEAHSVSTLKGSPPGYVGYGEGGILNGSGRLVTIPYYPLSDEILGTIIKLKLNKIVKRIKQNHDAEMTYGDDVIKLISDRCNDLDSGARVVDAILTNTVLPQVSQKFLEKMMEDINMPAAQSENEAKIKTPLGPDVLLLRDMSMTEELGRLFNINLNLLSEQDDINFEKGVSQTGYEGEYAAYQATVKPWFWFLTRTADCKIFQELSVPDIVMGIFRDLGYTDFEDKLTRNYRTWDYCVQYRETDFNFVSRLLEQEGIYYYFTHDDGVHKLVLSDGEAAHSNLPGESTIDFYPPDSTVVRNKDHIFNWNITKQVQPGKYELNEFDFIKPNANLETKSEIVRGHAVADYEIYDYPGEYNKTDDGEKYVQARIEELHCQYEQAQGKSGVRALTTGYKFKLNGYTREDQNREYLITQATHFINSHVYGSGGVGRGDPYSNSFSVIESTTPFRTSRTTPKPIVQGTQTAIVVGPSGEEIYTDEYGRVKIQFHWDRYGNNDENSSCWVRVAQIWAGKRWGGIHIPRIDQEVIVDFMEGDPDRPIITGRVYNAEQMPPYDLPANKTQSGVKSRSSKGGSAANFNEIRMEDKKGSEQIYIHAEKNQDNIVENNETTDVGHNRTEKVGNDEDITIGNNRTEKVGVNEDITIGANRTEKVGANEDITIAANRTENVGANETIMIGANQTQTIGANQTRTIGANHTQTIGANQVQSIAGTQTEVIAGTLLQTVAGGVTVVTPATYTLIATGGYTLIAPSSDSIFKAFDSAITGAKFEVVGSANGVTGSKIEATGMAVGYTGAKIENETTKFKNSVVELSVFYKVFGPFVKRNSNEKVILDEGTIYQAKVLTLVDTGGRQERHPEVTLTLEMRPQQGTPFEVEITTYVSVYQLSKLVPGSIITLKYDPKFPDSAVIKPLKLGVLTRCFEFNGKFHMGVSILAFMPLAEKKPSLLSETSMWKFTSEQLGQDSVLEAGIPKARPEFLVTGKAFTPNEDLKQGLPVKVKLGKQEKELLVFGDRFWDGDSPSEIKPFTEMPIDWQHAFGGNEFGQNPLGKGYSHIVENGVKVKWIPNIQSRQQQITSFDSKPEPVSYGPIDVMWPQRMSLQGTYDEEWTKKYYPGFPPDIDWGYFNLASKDQQFTEKLDGDEQYSIENMNAQHPLIEGNLPNIKACCFVTQKIEDDEVFEEVKTNLRTVWFFPNDNRAVLVFQGSIEVKEEDAADILHLIASAENRGEARSLDHYQKVLKQRLDKKKGGLYALQDSDLLPENLNTQDPDVELAEKQLEPSGHREDNLRRKTEIEHEAIRKKLLENNLDVEKYGPKPLPKKEKRPSLEELPKFLEKKQKSADEQKKKLDILKPKQEKELKALCKEQGLDYNEVQEQIKQSDWKPPELVAEIQLEGYQQKKQELELEGASSEEIKQKIGESKSYEDYVLKERRSSQFI